MEHARTPPPEVTAWLQMMADDNHLAASRSFWPWRRMKYRIRAQAFEATAEWINVWIEQDERKGNNVSEIGSFKARLFKDESGHFRFRIVATNGEPVAQSEGYSRKIDARTTAAALVGEENVEEVEE